MSVTVDGINYTLSGSNATVTGTSAGAASTTTVTIPSTITYLGNTYNVTTIGTAFFNYTKLASIIIPNSVLTIKWGAFNGCSSLVTVTIPNSVTTINQSVFEFCSMLTSVIIGSSIKNLEYGVFGGCSSLASVTFMGDIPTSIGTNNFTANTNDTAYYYSSTYNTPELAASRLGPIFTNLSTSPPSLKPSLSTLKSQNALKSTYDSNSYSLSDLVNSGLYTLPELKQNGYTLNDLKAFFTTDTLIRTGFSGSELKQEGLIESGITFIYLVIVFNGVFSVNRTYSPNNTNKEDTYYNVVFEGQYFPKLLTSISI